MPDLRTLSGWVLRLGMVSKNRHLLSFWVGLIVVEAGVFMVG